MDELLGQLRALLEAAGSEGSPPRIESSPVIRGAPGMAPLGRRRLSRDPIANRDRLGGSELVLCPFFMHGG